MYFCPLCNTRYTAEQPCFCHPGERSELNETIDSVHVDALTMEGMQRTRNPE